MVGSSSATKGTAVNGDTAILSRIFKSRFSSSVRLLLSAIIVLSAGVAIAQDATAPPQTLHPALFLVGDSIMKTGTGTGERGPWGWGSELVPLFDSAKIYVYNEGRGGRSSRGYIEEG